MATQTARLTESKILRAYAEKTPGSRALHERAKALLPNGVTHVGRYLEPHPVYIERAEGSRKWDVDGNEYVDYLGGHGALILGHNHPAVAAAVAAQAPKGVHYGASHALEVEWAEIIHQMIPSAERVRFTVSGTEATLLALRIARAFSGKNKIVRFTGHFHGWQDHVCFPPGGAAGVLPGIVEDTILVDPARMAGVEELLSSRGDIAAVILEPTGATFGHAPMHGDAVRQLREWTARHGVLLIFDEVISGFRCSPGGAQQHLGVTPDLTALAKIIAGGYPGAAVVGRADALILLDYLNVDGRIEAPRIVHQGTYNAGPVSAAAGIATLRQIRDTDAVERASRTAATIRDAMNAALRRSWPGWCAYGLFSDFHFYRGGASPEDIYAGAVPWQQLKGGMPPALLHKIRAGFLLHGVDIAGWPGGLVSAVHTDDDVQRTVAALEGTLAMLAAEGE
ncbi:MAG: aminotransferase class III-fold pyridoxal phosphate-dependent enzyme [Bryobacteraceae bacterium]